MENDGEAKGRVVNDETAAAAKGEEQKVAFYELFSFADKVDVVLMIVGSLFAIANGLAQPLSSVLLGDLINAFGTTPKSHTVEEVSKVALKFVYLAIGSGITSFLQVSSWMVTGERQSVRVRGLYLKAMLGQEIGFFDTQTTTGEVIGRMSADTILIQDALGEKVGNVIQQALTFLGGFIVAGIRGWLLALILISTIPVLVTVGGFAATITSKISEHEQGAYSEAGNVVEQTIATIRTVASFTGEKHAIEKYNVNLKIAYKATVRQGLTIGAGYGTMLLITFSTYGLAIWLGSKFIISKGYNGGQVMNIMIAVMVGGMSLSQIAPCLRAFTEGQVAAYKIFETIKRTSKIDPYDSSGAILEDVKGEIELQDVDFRYPARPEVQIFSGFSLRVPSGTTAALVGQSGSGKSTVISLIERFYDPDSGEILIDGVNLKKLKLSWIREKIGLVSQEPILFATSIKENVTYGKENATDQEIRTAMELANAAKFIDKMPKGLETMVGEHGIQLSSGQKQRIAIARAVLKNPKILLLDEATSALDVESEHVVQDALVKVMCNRTTVVVAHRLTTIKNANMIAVVHMGKIVEKGSHEELIKNADGAFSHLVSLQNGAKGFEDNCNMNTALSDSMNIDKSQSQKLPIERSTSESPTWHPFEISTTGFETPGYGDVHKNEEHEEETETNEVPENEEHEEDTRRNKRPEEVSIRRLAYLNKPELTVLLLGTIFAAIQGAVLPMFGFLLSNVIRVFFEPPKEMKKESKFWTLVCVGLALVNLAAITLQTYLFGIAGGKLIERIRSRTFEKIVHQEISWFDDPANSSGVVGARLSTDASGVRGLVGDTLALIVQNTSTIIVSFIIAFVVSWRLALIVLFMSPLLLVQAVIQTKFTKGFSADAKLMYRDASQVAADAVGNIRTIASFCAEKKVMVLYQKKCEGPMWKGVRHGLISGTSYGVSFLLLYSTIAFCFYCGALLVQHGKATFGELFKVVFAFCVAAVAVSQSSDLAPNTAKGKDSATSIFGILDKMSAIDSSIDQGITLEEVNGCIEIEHVSFRYPIRPDIRILRDLSLIIPSGKIVALVGESGSGKSTVISLIERFYDPDSGHIYLDGVEIRQLKLRWLREQIGLVSQEPILFNETIRANIAYGKHKNFTEEEMMAATNAANAHDFISSLPEGYDTLVGKRGVLLSGGQKQRIALARVILRNPKILLLDEATSALDAQSEHIVQNAMERIMMNRTTIVVAHRLITIKGADMIAVVKNGAIVEKGKHDDLMNIVDGEYASLVTLDK